MRGVLGNNRCLDSPEKILKEALLHKSIIHILLIIIVGLIAYSNTFNVPFQFDDNPNIVENYKLRNLSNLWPPSGSRWFGFYTFALNYYLGGLNTFGYHIVNLTIHILNAILVYFLVVLTFKTPYFKVSVISASVSNQPNQFNLSTFQPFNYLPLFIALLFASHPIQTQAVTYIVQRFTSLATMFYLLSLVMYIKFRSQQSVICRQRSALHPSLPLEGGGQGRGWRPRATRYTLYAVSLVSAILAMKTKEISFTLPIIIVLYEFMFFEGKIKRRILFLMPIILTMLIIPLSLIGIDKPIGDAIGELREAAQETDEIPRWSYLFTQFRVITTYIGLLFLPVNQNLDYDYPIYHSFFEPNVFLSFLFLLSIFGLGVYLFYRPRNNPPSPPFSKGGMGGFHGLRLTAFGIFWFFVALSVESSVIPIRDVINEHRLYLPSVGIIIAFISTIFYVSRPKVRHYVFPFLLVIIVITLSITTYQRNIVWQDAISLWGDAAAKSPNKARPNYELGVAYGKFGDKENAFYYMKKASQLDPFHFKKALFLRAESYLNRGLLDEAIKEYQKILKANPNQPEIFNAIGNIYLKKGLLIEAVQEYTAAIKLNPEFSIAYCNRGFAYFQMGIIEEAIKEYREAIRLDPRDPEPHAKLGFTYLKIGLLNEAEWEFQNALKLNPKHKSAKKLLASTLRLKANKK